MADQNDLSKTRRLRQMQCAEKAIKKKRSDSKIIPLKNDKRRRELFYLSLGQNLSIDQINSENVALQRAIGLRPLLMADQFACSDNGFLRHDKGNTEDPTKRLPNYLVLQHCRECQSYFSRSAIIAAKIRALPDSKELLDFLMEVLECYMSKAELELKGAQFVQRKPTNSRRMFNVHLALQVQALDLPKQDIIPHTLVVCFEYQPCTSCAPMVGWNSVVQLRPHGSNKQPRHNNLARLICKNRSLSDLIMNVKQVGQGTDFFFYREKDAIEFSGLLPKFYTIKRGKIHKSNTMSSESCIPAWICPIYWLDLVYLPPKVSATLGNLGPLVICKEATSKLTFLDPINMRKCTLSANEYGKAPFEPLMTSKELIKSVVLDVEIVSGGISRYALADVQVARVSDFGKNDKTFSVRSHLGHRLNAGDYALGYDLCTANINSMEVEKCKDLLPEFILVDKIRPHVFLRNSKIAMKKRSPEYEGFLRDLENNPEAMFNLSLKSAEDEVQTSDMTSLKEREKAVFDMENLLADLCLSDEGDDEDTS